MVAVRFATAMRPLSIPALWSSVMSLIIPQMAVFAPWQLGGVLSKDYFSNPISFASVNGFPALNLLMWFNFKQMVELPVTSWYDLSNLWVDSANGNYTPALAVSLGVLPFVGTGVYKLASSSYGWTPPANFPGDGRTFFGLIVALFLPCYVYLFCIGWSLADVHKVVWACASLMPIWWVNCLGGVDLWIEEPLGMPAREIAFTPTWIVTHGVFFVQWALDPKDYINRAVFLLYMCPQMTWLNYYFRLALRQDWGTQLPIYYSYFMHIHMVLVELWKWMVEIREVGLYEIHRVLWKDCPLHFTPAQLTVLLMVVTAFYFAPNAKYRWSLYSLCGPLNWLGLI
jgi:hypothetical protein